jgi:hypothetical protein
MFGRKLKTDPVLHMLGLASPWLETDSNDPKVAEVSAKVLETTSTTDMLGPPTRDLECHLLWFNERHDSTAAAT